MRFILSDFNSGFDVSIFLRLRKVEFFFSGNYSHKHFLIEFVKFEIKQFFLAYQDQYFVWFSLAH